jgi:O-antigen/teichoic acid export membrane protein
VSRVKLLQIFPIFLILVGAVLAFERPAYAYADPGTGLLAVQAAGSALVATGWYLRRKIYSLFRSDDAPKSEPDDRSAAANGEDSPNP